MLVWVLQRRGGAARDGSVSVSLQTRVRMAFATKFERIKGLGDASKQGRGKGLERGNATLMRRPNRRRNGNGTGGF
jgi:hypothetical protein